MTPTPEDDAQVPGAQIAVAQISAVQCWSDPLGLETNTAKVDDWYGRVADRTDLVVFPELTLSGYIPLKGYDQNKKRILSEVADRTASKSLPALARATKGRRAAMVVGFMEPSSMRHEIYNSVALIQDGAILGVYRKMHLPVEENHYFVPGDETVVVDCRAGRVGLTICYDIVFPESARLAALQGAEILIATSNWLGIQNLKRLGEVLPVARALEQQCHVVFVNGVGQFEIRGHVWDLYGTSLIVSAKGEVVAKAGGSEEMLQGFLPRSALADAANVFPLMRDRRPDAYGDMSSGRTRFAKVKPGQFA